MERPGFLRSDLPIKRGKRTRFFKSAYRHDLHLGIDYSVALGTPVRAVHDGVIVAQGVLPSTSEVYVMLRVKRGLRYQLIAFYTHLQKGSFRFKKGDHVREGQIIALSGNTGIGSGAHLHFDLRRGFRWQAPLTSWGWMFIDPQPFIDGLPLTRIA